MSRSRFTVLPLTAILVGGLMVGCSEGPTAVSDREPTSGEFVITQGVATPVAGERPLRPSLSSAGGAVTSTLGGSMTTPVSLKPQSCEPGGQQVTITYTVTGRQDNPASFKVNTRWEYNGATWSGSVPTTVNVATRPTGPGSNTYLVTLTLVNASAAASGSSSFSVVPFDLVTSAPAALGITGANVNVFVQFAACPVINTPPVLTLPSDMTVEATSSAGAAVNFTVMASDAQDGDLTSSVVCTPSSGSTFPLGETTVNCSVTDAGGLSASGSFNVKVQDTTAPVFSGVPSGVTTLIAANINGAQLDIAALGISAADVGDVSPPVTIDCTPADETTLAIGSTTTVSCTASDNSQYPSPNTSDPVEFTVFVTLDVSGVNGFLPPLRMLSPYSVHKRGSTIPHKFLPPAYADGTPATDLAGGLRLVLNHIDGTVEGGDVEVNDYTAGSTTWRYDATAGQYIFNLKSGTSSPWDVGSWKTTVSYAGIVLATTYFDLKK
jgi:HYR domain